MQSVQRLHSTNSDQRRPGDGVHTVLPETHTFIYEWNEPFCILFVSVHQMASSEQADVHLDSGSAYYSIYRLRVRKDERLSWHSWLTYSGRFTHKWSHTSGVYIHSTAVISEKSTFEHKNV